MATFGELKTRVARDLKRSDLTADISEAVLDAIQDHGVERFWFNDTESYSLTLTSGNETYTITPVAPIQEFIEIDWIKILIGGTAVWDVEFVSRDELLNLASGSVLASGQPMYYTYNGNDVIFYPIPATTYFAAIGGHYRLIDLVNDSDSNAWTNQAKNLIRYSALKRLYAYPIRNVDQAQVATAAETLELEYLRRTSERRVRSGQMAPYYG